LKTIESRFADIEKNKESHAKSATSAKAETGRNSLQPEISRGDAEFAEK
jgi:hypothetical protein